MTFPSEQFTGRSRVVILKDNQKPSEADLWPGDTVWDSQFQTIGRVNEHGRFVPGDHVGRQP